MLRPLKKLIPLSTPKPTIELPAPTVAAIPRLTGLTSPYTSPSLSAVSPRETTAPAPTVANLLILYQGIAKVTGSATATPIRPESMARSSSDSSTVDNLGNILAMSA